MTQRNGLQQFSRGFLPVADPLTHLPKVFSAWENLASELPKLLMSNQLRQTIEKMPPFPTDKLRTVREYDRAMLILSFIGHAYVWSEQTPIKLLPKVLAQPWYAVAKKCGRPPVLSYASYALNNWRRINSELPIELGNIALLQNFHGGQDEEWFVLVHIAIEAKATPAIQSIVLAQQGIKKHDVKVVAENLQIIWRALFNICELLDRMPERCDPYIYYQRVRPYIHGWKGNLVYPQGLIYEGVSEYNSQPQQFRGETGAQSTIIPALDGLLNISHENDLLGEYLKEMRLYMPPAHRAYLEVVEKTLVCATSF